MTEQIAVVNRGLVVKNGDSKRVKAGSIDNLRKNAGLLSSNSVEVKKEEPVVAFSKKEKIKVDHSGGVGMWTAKALDINIAKYEGSHPVKTAKIANIKRNTAVKLGETELSSNVIPFETDNKLFDNEVTVDVPVAPIPRIENVATFEQQNEKVVERGEEPVIRFGGKKDLSRIINHYDNVEHKINMDEINPKDIEDRVNKALSEELVIEDNKPLLGTSNSPIFDGTLNTEKKNDIIPSVSEQKVEEEKTNDLITNISVKKEKGFDIPRIMNEEPKPLNVVPDNNNRYSLIDDIRREKEEMKRQQEELRREEEQNKQVEVDLEKTITGNKKLEDELNSIKNNVISFEKLTQQKLRMKKDEINNRKAELSNQKAELDSRRQQEELRREERQNEINELKAYMKMLQEASEIEDSVEEEKGLGRVA